MNNMQLQSEGEGIFYSYTGKLLVQWNKEKYNSYYLLRNWS